MTAITEEQVYGSMATLADTVRRVRISILTIKFNHISLAPVRVQPTLN